MTTSQKLSKQKRYIKKVKIKITKEKIDESCSNILSTLVVRFIMRNIN